MTFLTDQCQFQIPNRFLNLKATKYDWGYRTEASENFCRALSGGCYWPRGKMLGGTGAIGSMIYLRGFPSDYNQWADQGNLDWDFDTVLHYFKRSENNSNADNPMSPDYHSTSGPLKVSLFNSNETLRNVFLDAAREFNYDLVKDFNGEDRIGYAFVQGTIHDGIRQSSGKAYLTKSVGDRPNLHVIKEAHVLKLEFNEQGEVNGVRFNFNSTKEYRAVATKEVVLSAGAINTPHILMLSGIGSQQELTKLRIKSRVDLGVGKNLQDHAMVMMFFRFNQSLQSSTSVDNNVNLFNYLYSRSGPLAHPTNDLIGYINTKYWIDNHPDIQYSHYMFPAAQTGDELQKKLTSIGLREQFVKQLISLNHKSALGLVYVMLTNPRSRGQIVLRNNNPVYKPKIIPNFFGEKDDVESLVRGLQFYEQFVNTTTFQRIGGQLVRLPIADCDKMQYLSIKYWECYSKHFSSSLYHPVGTAKMGGKSDPEAVVDNRLKVHGMQGLRVADASVMPTIPSGHTDAAAIMIGERVVDFIRDDWN